MAKASKTDKIAAAAAARPKARRLKGKYSEMDLKATGPMPEWGDMDMLSAEQHIARWKTGKYFYYYHHDIKELRPFIVELYSKEWSKEKLKSFNKVKDSQISPQVGAMCKMVLDGARWLEESKLWCDKHLDSLIAKVAGEPDTDEEAPKVVEPKRIGIAERVNDIKEELLGELELYEDMLIRERKLPNINVLSWLRQKNVPQQIIPSMIDFYGVRLAFLLEAKAGKDAQLKEAYGHYKKKDWDNWIKWYNDVITDLDALKRTKAATRKVRVRKPASPEKLVRKLKFQKDFAELGLVSIKPTEIVHATQLWVYNTKTRKLGRYIASDIDKSLTVKGSTILGWDPKTSVAKTLRKPKEQLKQFMDSGKVQLRTFLDKIKATEVQLNGRTNAQTILLRADK